MITYTLDELIKMLEKEKEVGAKFIMFKGTLFTPENGNKIIITTEKQF
jgi:hypothetical protein